MTAAADSLTVLHSINSRLATKRISCSPKTGAVTIRSYGREHHFRIGSIAVDGFGSLCAALDRLTKQPFAFVIRGAPLPGANLQHCRRLLHSKRQTGEPATLAMAARHWFAVDIDHVAAPALTDPITDPDAAIEYLIGRLPPELADASCWWQFTSSQSLPRHQSTVSARLWYWAATPLTDDELSRWAAAANRNGKLIDPSLYRAVQAHYIAAPVFTGMADPLPRRSGIRRALEDEVVLIIPPPEPHRPNVVSGQGYEPGRGVQAYLAEIGGGQGFRRPIISAIGSYFAVYSSGGDCSPLKQAICAAINRADPGGRPAEQIERRRSDAHLDDLITWVRAHHGDQPPKGFTPEPPPEFEAQSPPLPEPEDNVQASPPRPVVRLVNGELPLAIDRAEALLTAADPGLYAFGEQIVRPAPRPIRVANHGGDKRVIGLRLVPVAAGHMNERFTRCIDFRKFNPKIEQWLPV